MKTGQIVLATATAAKTGSTVTATFNDTDVTVQVARDQSVASGDVLTVVKIGSEWFALSRVYSAAPAPPPPQPPAAKPPPPKPTVVTGTLVVSPIETRSWRPTWGWRTDNTDIYQGEWGSNGNHIGSAFYGSKPRTLAGATVTRVTLKAYRVSGGTYAAQPTTIRGITQATRPAGQPTLGGASTPGPSLAVGASTSAFVLPDSWGQLIVDGTYGGLAVFDADGSPYVRFAGRGSWSPAFTLTISWLRNT